MKTHPRRHARRKPAARSLPAQKRPAGRPAATAVDEVLPRSEGWAEVPCPHCGELMEVMVGADEDGHSRLEDCSVCCRSVVLQVTWDDGDLRVEADRA